MSSEEQMLERSLTKQPGGNPAFPLSYNERQWIRSKWEKIRKSQRMADQSNSDWHRINDQINEKHASESKRRAERGDFPLTDLLKAQAKSDSIALRDALEVGKWHSAESQRHIDDLSLFLRMKELGIL